MPDIVRNYYDRNWHPIRQEWVDGLKQTMNLCTRTNNRIESFFKHLKSYITSRGSIEELIEGYMSVLSILRNERSYRLLKHLSTVPTKPVSDTEADYLGHVTPYALLQIQEQLKYSLQVTVVCPYILLPTDCQMVYTTSNNQGPCCYICFKALYFHNLSLLSAVFERPFCILLEAFVLDLQQRNIRWAFTGRRAFTGRKPL